MKNFLLPPTIARIITSARGYAQGAMKPQDRFKTFSLKPALLKITLVVFSLFFVNAAFANVQVNSITVASPQTSVYGNTSLTVTVNLNHSGGGGGNNERITLTSAAGGITLNPNPTNYTAGGNTTTITLTIPGNLAVGTYAVTINNQDRTTNVNSPATFNVNITQRPLNVTASSPAAITYGAAIPAITVAYSNFAPGDTQGSVVATPATGSTTATSTSGAGTYPTTASGAVLTAAGATNYTINYVAGSLTINKITLTVTAGSVTASNKTYDGTTVATVSGGTLNGVINGDDVSVSTVGAFSSAAVGTNKTVTISLTGANAGNYTVTQPTLRANITVATLTITPTATKVYGTTLTSGNGKTTFTTTGLQNGETVGSIRITYGTGAAATAGVTTYTGTAIGSAATGGTFNAANYTVVFAPGNIVVTPANLTITLSNPTRTYGAANTFTPTYTGFVNGDTKATVVITAPTYSSSATATSSVAGSPYTVTANNDAVLNGNYTAVYVTTGGLTITKATLTVIPDNLTKVQGAANPPLTFTVTGFQNSETVAVLTSQPTLTTTAVTGSPAGAYPITATGGSAANYTLTYQTGQTLTVQTAVYDWTGASGLSWATPQNWSVNGAQQTVNYPGSVGTADVVHIGVNTTITNFPNQPTLGATPTHAIASITFGNSAGPETLTMNTGAALTVPSFTVNANTVITVVDNGPVSITGNFSNGAGSTFTLSGSGSSFSVQTFNNITNAGTLTQTGSSSITLSNTTFAGSIVNSGTINQGGTGNLTLSILAIFGTITNSGTINQTGTGNFTATINSFAGNIVNSGTISQSSTGKMTFGVPYSNSAGSQLTQTGAGTLAFTSTFDNTGTTLFGPGTITMGDDFTNHTGGTTTFGSGNATLSGDFDNTGGTTTFGSGGATVAGNFNNTGGTTAFTTGSVSVAGDFTNSATVTTSTGTESFASMNFTNSGPLTFGTGLVTFNNTHNVTKFAANTSFTFVNVLFSGGQNVQLPHSGNVYLASSGVLTMSNSTQISAGGGSFTLLSDATGSATIAAIPTGCTFTAPVNVQRFIKGSSDQTKRGYRLLTSTVYTDTDPSNGANVYNLQYLTSTFVSGYLRAANGFNVPSTDNPSIYLFREDDPPPPSASTVFTTGYNWKGVAKINNSPLYGIGTQARNTPYNTSDTTTSIPVGNGILYYFRGAGTTNVNNYTAPFANPTDATLTETGNLNTGTIQVRLWYSNAGNNLNNNLSFTSSYTPGNSGSGSALTAGFTLVGNPYPSTINWEKYNNPAASGALTGSVTNTIYVFDEANKQYEAYIASNADVNTLYTQDNSSNATGSASNYIASGQGFFVESTAPGQTLTFTENAKISAQPSTTYFPNLMGKPVPTAAAPIPYFRLKLVKDSINSDDIVIRFNNNASNKYVKGEDAADIGGGGALESLSSYSSDSTVLAINTLPLPGKKPLVIRLLVDVTASGTYQLTVPNYNNLPQLYVVWLKDAFTGDSVQLKKGLSYPVTIDNSNAATFGSSRFTVVISQDTAFAYKLLSFTGEKTSNGRNAQLVWKTANEQNYTNFTVERSSDNGKTFDVVGGMQGTGAGTYSLLDKNPDKGDNLYRLKQEDINNVITYSNTVKLIFTGNNDDDKFHIYPNPASHTINLDLSAKISGNITYDIIVTNSLGFVVKQGTSTQTNWQANVSDLRPGTYLVSVLNKREKNLIGQTKFVKL